MVLPHLHTFLRLCIFLPTFTIASQPVFHRSIPPIHIVPHPTFPFTICDDFSAEFIDCGVLQVPLDWHDPTAGATNISFARLSSHSAKTRKGTVFYHAGYSYLGASFSPYQALVVTLYENAQLDLVVADDYDLVIWQPRDRDIAPRCFEDAEERIAFYNSTFRAERGVAPPWNDQMVWEKAQNNDDIRFFLHAQEKLVAYCLENTDSAVYKYVGTAATVRDLVALADALDGTDSPINLWTQAHGSVLTNHLLKMFPERIGRIVVEDPVDPVAYSENEALTRWAEQIASANTSLALFEKRLAAEDSDGFQISSEYPALDEMYFENAAELLARELTGWQDHYQAQRLRPLGSVKLIDTQIQAVLQARARGGNSVQRWMSSFCAQQSLHINGWRTGSSSSSFELSAMPLVCGDALRDHLPAADDSTREAIEATLVDHMHSAPLIGTSVFPAMRYLCHLWPIRAVERVPVGPPYEASADKRVLVLLRRPDYWNYFAVSEATARKIWPNAIIIADQQYGDLAWNHNQCTLDIVKRYFHNGTLLDGFEACEHSRRGW